MIRNAALILIAMLSAAVHAQTAQEILEEVINRDLQRKATVQNYIVNQCTMGVPMMLYYERVERVVNGMPVINFRLVTPDEISERQNGGVRLTPQEMDWFATGLEQTGDALSREAQESGLPVSSFMLPQSYDEPWASPDPRVMMGSMATFMRAAATAQQNRQINGQNTEVASSAEQLRQLVDDAELVGVESIEGRQAYHIRVDEVDYSQIADAGQQFDMDTVSIWIDQDQYVPLRMRMNGIADVDGDEREMFIEMLSLDYQQVGPLYEPARQVMSMGGVLTQQEEAQIREAEAQLAEARQQLDQLSGQQQEMLRNMLGPQMEMLENLVSTGTIRVETLTPRIRVNAGLPDQVEMASALSDTSPCPSTSGFFDTPPAGSATGFDGSTNRGSQAPVDTQAILAAQQQCLEDKIEAAQESRPRRRGLGGLLGGVGQAVSQIGNLDIAGLAGGLFDPGASDEDIEERARELGLSEQDIAECRAAQPEPSAAPALDF